MMPRAKRIPLSMSKRYYVIQFLVEEKYAWEVTRDIRLIFATKAHSIQQIPHTEEDEEVIEAPQEKPPRRQQSRRRGRGTGPRGGILRAILKRIVNGSGEWMDQRQVARAVAADPVGGKMSLGNIPATLKRMSLLGEIERRIVRGRKQYRGVGNGRKESEIE